MPLLIRSATKKDAHAIVELNTQLANYHVKLDRFYRPGSATRKLFKKHLLVTIRKRHARVLVAETNRRIVGYFIGTIENARPFVAVKKIGRVSDAFVAQKYRGTGIGKKMLGELIEWFKTNGIKQVELSVDARNEIGVKAWHRLGFKVFMLRMRLDL